jgi:hypothetical protein
MKVSNFLSLITQLAVNSAWEMVKLESCTNIQLGFIATRAGVILEDLNLRILSTQSM